MADNSATFIKRVISGLLAVSVLSAVSYFGGTQGLLLLCTGAMVLGVREFARMSFRQGAMPAIVGQAYWLICLLSFSAMFLYSDRALLWFAAANIAFMASVLWLTRSKVSNENLLAALALGTFGLLYCVLFPYYAVQLVQLDQGNLWFLFLLFLVFFGDIFAYFCGRWMGGPKLMPMISPNKTWSGSMGGLLGSALAGALIMDRMLPDVPLGPTILFCLACGAAAQSGDLLMSLVKRVAQVKDSGSIMPGHGGVFDRLDGVFIACPLVYAFALYVTPA